MKALPTIDDAPKRAKQARLARYMVIRYRLLVPYSILPPALPGSHSPIMLTPARRLISSCLFSCLWAPRPCLGVGRQLLLRYSTGPICLPTATRPCHATHHSPRVTHPWRSRRGREEESSSSSSASEPAAVSTPTPCAPQVSTLVCGPRAGLMWSKRTICQNPRRCRGSRSVRVLAHHSTMSASPLEASKGVAHPLPLPLRPFSLATTESFRTRIRKSRAPRAIFPRTLRSIVTLGSGCDWQQKHWGIGTLVERIDSRGPPRPI